MGVVLCEKTTLENGTIVTKSILKEDIIFMNFKNIPKIFFLKGFLSFIATCFPFNFLRVFF